MDNDNFFVECPDPVYVNIVAGLFRTFLAAAMGFGLGWAAGVTGEQVMMMATAATIVGTGLWSAYQKIQAHRKNKRAAMQSAIRSAEATSQAGQPVAIAVLNPKAP